MSSYKTKAVSLFFAANQELGECVRNLREQGLTFSQISETLKLPLSTCYSALRALKLSKDYTERLKMVVKKRKRENPTSLHLSGSCDSNLKIKNLGESHPLSTSTSSTLSSAYSSNNQGLITSHLLQKTRHSDEASAWHQNQRNLNMKYENGNGQRFIGNSRSSTAEPAASSTDTEQMLMSTSNQVDSSFLNEVRDSIPATAVKACSLMNDYAVKTFALEENTENMISQKLKWALEQLENSNKPEEIVQLMNVVSTALNILNSLKDRNNSTA
ncbi:unnamed protein product [Thelazia callipaeda]|uniref:HTH iclR-type domain-containing protein n=1 Tax=Thelazia callipaeda TaxID=103827 RepID=A0A0N5CM93_THECL|nr:unnamed protein product [Thelazia callipaeda]